MACNRLCNPQTFTRKNVPRPHPGYEPEPSGYELAPTCFIVRVFHGLQSLHAVAPTCFIVRVFHGLQSSHAGHEKMSHIHTRDMNQNLWNINLHWPLHVSSQGLFFMASNRRTQAKKMVFDGSRPSHAGQEKYPTAIPAQRVESSPGPKKNHRKVSIPAPGVRPGGFEPRSKKKQRKFSIRAHHPLL